MPRGRKKEPPLPHAQEVTPVGAATIPERPPAELLPPDECAQLVWDAVVPLLKNKAEIATFRVRPGVTLRVDRDGDPVLEVFLRDRVKAVGTKRVSQVVKNGTMEIYARGLLEDLQDRHPFGGNTVAYNRVDVLREILYELEDLLPGGNPEVLEFDERSPAWYSKKIELIRERIKEKLRAIEE